MVLATVTAEILLCNILDVQKFLVTQKYDFIIFTHEGALRNCKFLGCPVPYALQKGKR
jgi:hypothetical protein